MTDKLPTHVDDHTLHIYDSDGNPLNLSQLKAVCRIVNARDDVINELRQLHYKLKIEANNEKIYLLRDDLNTIISKLSGAWE